MTRQEVGDGCRDILRSAYLQEMVESRQHHRFGLRDQSPKALLGWLADQLLGLLSNDVEHRLPDATRPLSIEHPLLRGAELHLESGRCILLGLLWPPGKAFRNLVSPVGPEGETQEGIYCSVRVSRPVQLEGGSHPLGGG